MLRDFEQQLSPLWVSEFYLKSRRLISHTQSPNYLTRHLPNPAPSYLVILPFLRLAPPSDSFPSSPFVK